MRHALLSDLDTFQNVSMVAHSIQTSCQGEPIITELANRLGRTTAQLATRFVLEQGLPALIQTSHEKHLQENLGVFDFQVSSGDLSTLGLLQAMYSLGDLSLIPKGEYQ